MKYLPWYEDFDDHEPMNLFFFIFKKKFLSYMDLYLSKYDMSSHNIFVYPENIFLMPNVL